MGLTPSASQNFATCVAFIILTAMAVIARFVTRVTLGQRPTIPDWLSLLSLAFFYAYCIVIINCTLTFLCFSRHVMRPGYYTRLEG